MSSIRPEHYKQTSLECFDVLRIALGKERFIGFCLGNAIKYLWRHEHKMDMRTSKSWCVFG